jgi:Domain of Unknown Function (DUF1080)
VNHLRQNLTALGTIGAVLALLVTLTGVDARQSVAREQVFPLTDIKDLAPTKNVSVEATEFKGRKAVKVTKQPNSGDSALLLTGTDFQDGTIEADVAVKVLTPPGVRSPGFVGIMFRTTPDGMHGETFYVRPGNGRADDQAQRNHASQYMSTPDHGWYRLRREWPSVYETYVDLQPETWIHLKIDVKGRTAALFVNGASQPTIKVDGLKGRNLRGAIGLGTFWDQEAYYSNLRITHAVPESVTNGGEATGTWQVRAGTDAGAYEGTLTLRREADRISGTWSGTFGTNLPVTGIWRDGYVELTFAGDWPRNAGGKPGPATATFNGWIDGTTAKGRMRVDGRADGTWSATRTSSS